MLQQRVNLGLKTILVVTGLAILHLIGSVFGGLGLISDGFLAIGLIQSIRFLFNADFRYEASESFDEFINVNEVTTSTAEYIGKALGQTVTSSEAPQVELLELEDLNV